MGYQLRRDLREALGPDIKGLQRAVALEIADDANDTTRESIVKLETLVLWTSAGSTDVVRNALKRLSEAGWEFRVPIGKGKDGRTLFAVPGVRMTFKVPPFTVVGGATATPKREQGLPHGGAGAPPQTPEGGAGAPSEGAGARSEGAGAPPYSSLPSLPSKRSNRDAAAEAGAPPSQPERDYEMTKFGAFWLAYPRSKQIEKAKAAWRDALDRGAEADHIVAAATAYAQERVGKPAKYTPYPATWLADGRYEDEPDSDTPDQIDGPSAQTYQMEDFYSGFAS